uniref:Uncharacterized protein n=1 Tax=Brassica oleracea TaxID=3712 RepID=A0A3P6DNZ8_BRAOL|nr:unnamed protein product [Brassica oleracea]
MCKFSLYMEIKILIRLNIFDTEDFWKTYAGCVGRLLFKFSVNFLWKTSGRLSEDFWKTYGRLLEDFDLGGKPKLFQN